MSLLLESLEHFDFAYGNTVFVLLLLFILSHLCLGSKAGASGLSGASDDGSKSGTQYSHCATLRTIHHCTRCATSLRAIDSSCCAAAEEPRTSAPQSDKVTDGLRLLEVVDGYNFSAIEQRSRLTAGMPARAARPPHVLFSSSRAPRAELQFRSLVHLVSSPSLLSDPEFLVSSRAADADLRVLCRVPGGRYSHA